MSTLRPVTADDVIVDVGGCQHHTRHRLGCVYCDRNRDKMLQFERERHQLASFFAATQLDGKRPYYDDVAEQYNAGLDR